MKVLLILLLSPLFGLAQNGSISGNVFWKYNEYVGNRADAGGKVYLFSTDTTAKPLEVDIDLQGNYSFNNLLPGKYLLVVKSKNTNSQGDDTFVALADVDTKPYMGFSFKESAKQQFDKTKAALTHYYEVVESSDISGKKSKEITKLIKQMQESKTEYVKTLPDLFGKAPHKMQSYFDLYSPTPNKINVKEVEIKDQDEKKTFVTDFGTTFF